jgi:type I restriction enzyme, S subunit
VSFPRYPEYKDSGVEWLGQVPAHWGLARLKRSLRSERNGIWGAEPQGDENDIACVRVADFDRNRLVVSSEELTVRNVTEREREGRLLMPNDLLIEKSGGGETQPVGCVVLYDHSIEAVCSNFIARLSVADAMNASYWRYFHAAAYTSRMNVRSIKQTSGIQNLDTQAYFDELAVFPPLQEQDAIGRFLDGETAKIDALVAEQERLIALLKEKRQAVISHAVTKGLNPNAPMKHSGVESMGPVPAHWNVTRLKYAAIPNGGIQMGPFGGMLVDLSHVHTGYKVFGQENTITGDFTAGSRWISEARFVELESYRVRDGDLLLTRKGSLGNARLVHDLPTVGIIDSDTIRVRADHQRVVPEFLAMLLHESAYMSSQIDQSKRGAILSGLNTSTIANLYIALPPVAEQEGMLDSLESTTAMIDEARETCSRMVDLLCEHRSALITAVVTGQIDVRGSIVSEAA